MIFLNTNLGFTGLFILTWNIHDLSNLKPNLGIWLTWILRNPINFQVWSNLEIWKFFQWNRWKWNLKARSIRVSLNQGATFYNSTECVIGMEWVETKIIHCRANLRINRQPTQCGIFAYINLCCCPRSLTTALAYWTVEHFIHWLIKKLQRCWKATIPGAGHLPSFFVPTPGHLDSLCVPTQGNLPTFFKKILMPGG